MDRSVPNVKGLMIAALVASMLIFGFNISRTDAAQRGPKVLAHHAYSECQGDGFWHVVTDTYYANPDGSVTKIRTYDKKTLQPCKDKNGQPLTEPTDVKELVNKAGSAIEMSAQDYQVGVEDGEMIVPKCEGGVWVKYYYRRFRMPDGSYKRDHIVKKRELTEDPCGGKFLGGDTVIIDGGKAAGVGTTSDPPQKLGDPVTLPGGGLPDRRDTRLQIPGAPTQPPGQSNGQPSSNSPIGAFPDVTKDAMLKASPIPIPYPTPPVNAAIQVTNAGFLNSAAIYELSQDEVATMLEADAEAGVMAETNHAPSRLPWFAWIKPGLTHGVHTQGARSSTSPPSFRRATGLPVVHELQANLSSVRTPPIVQVLFTALGKSSGKAFTMTVLSTAPQPLTLFGKAFVLQPVAKLTASQAERELGKLPGKRTTATITAYCLNMLKLPPAAGMVYRLAPQSAQQRATPFARIMEASKRLKDAGALHPDVDPEEHFHIVRQWAVWTLTENLNEQTYVEAVVDHTKKKAQVARRHWTKALEDAVRTIAPRRWSDIQAILQTARSLPQ